MKCLFAESPLRIVMVLLIAVSAIFFFSVIADAAVYDDFKKLGIDTHKWTVIGEGFTQLGDGYLHYYGTTPDKDQITSTQVFSSGIFAMSFEDYSSDNDAPPGEGFGSVVALGLGCRDCGAWVRIERGQVQGTSIGQYIEVNWAFQSDWDNIYVNYIQSDIASGALRVRYDGKNVTFFYRAHETDPWRQMVVTGQGGQPVLDVNGQTQPLVITPGWTTAVPMFIQAIPGGAIGTPYDYFLSFKIDNVTTNKILKIIRGYRDGNQ